MSKLRWIFDVLRYGEWLIGCEFWEGKPMLAFYRYYYNGCFYVLHVGPFYIECDYFGRPWGNDER